MFRAAFLRLPAASPTTVRGEVDIVNVKAESFFLPDQA
jgi:hypothetical protein